MGEPILASEPFTCCLFRSSDLVLESYYVDFYSLQLSYPSLLFLEHSWMHQFVYYFLCLKLVLMLCCELTVLICLCSNQVFRITPDGHEDVELLQKLFQNMTVSPIQSFISQTLRITAAFSCSLYINAFQKLQCQQQASSM